jgi:hypothetical protein
MATESGEVASTHRPAKPGLHPSPASVLVIAPSRPPEASTMNARLVGSRFVRRSLVLTKSTRRALSAGAITLLTLAWISGCSVNADPDLTPPSQSSATGETTAGTPLQPDS